MSKKDAMRELIRKRALERQGATIDVDAARKTIESVKQRKISPEVPPAQPKEKENSQPVLKIRYEIRLQETSYKHLIDDIEEKANRINEKGKTWERTLRLVDNMQDEVARMSKYSDLNGPEEVILTQQAKNLKTIHSALGEVPSYKALLSPLPTENKQAPAHTQNKQVAAILRERASARASSTEPEVSPSVAKPKGP